MTNRRGFTLLEIVVVLTVGAILLSISVNAFGQVRSRYAVREARNSFASLVARARAQAIEYAQTTEVSIDTSGDSAWVERNDSILERMRFTDEFGVDVTGSSGTYTLCLNSRGYGGSCTSFSSTVTVKFVTPLDTASIGIMPLGQVVY